MSSVTPTSRGISLLSVNVFFCVLAGVTVVSRCYTRAVLVKSFGLDDWMMVLATVRLNLAYLYSKRDNRRRAVSCSHHVDIESL